MAEGAGLYRTEFLYMYSTMKCQQKKINLEAYKAVLEGMNGKPVVVRTMDTPVWIQRVILTITTRDEPISQGYRALHFTTNLKCSTHARYYVLLVW